MGYNFSGTNAMSRKIIEKHRKEGGKTNTPRVAKEKDPVRAEGEKYRKLTASIEVEGQSMDSSYKVRLMPQTQFEEDVNSIFAITLPQYCGCTLTANAQRQMQLTIYFEDRPDLAWANGTVRAVKSIYDKDAAVNTSMDLIERTNHIYRNRQRIWELTQEGKDILAPFVSREFIKGDPADNNFNWENQRLSYEVTEKIFINGYGFNVMPSSKLAVNLDINRVLSMMYGAKNEEGHKFYYMMIPLSPLPSLTFHDDNGHQIIHKYLIEILQADAENIDKLVKDVYMGMAANSGSLHIHRPKRQF